MEPIGYSDGADPHNVLRNVMTSIKHFLGKLIVDPFRYSLAYQVDIKDDLKAAYDDTIERNFSKCLHDIETATPEALETYGLAGPSLKAKVKGLNALSDAMNRGLRKAVLWLLNLINSILGSLGKLTIFVDAIKELKDLFESTTDLVTG